MGKQFIQRSATIESFFFATQFLLKSLIIIEGVLWPVVQETRSWFSPSVFGIGDDG